MLWFPTSEHAPGVMSTLTAILTGSRCLQYGECATECVTIAATQLQVA